MKQTLYIKFYALGESGVCYLFDCPHFLELYYYPDISQLIHWGRRFTMVSHTLTT